MKTLQLNQGSKEWHEHRSTHWNASDAPAMMGCSPYKSRSELLRERATGVSTEIDAATQRLFDEGHRIEALARPLAEEIIGDELYPCVGERGEYSASFDGLTLDYETAFEHKTLNAALRAAFDAIDNGADPASALPLHNRVQMEHQGMVSGAKRVLFMASKWEGDRLVEERHTWYKPDPELRANVINGWSQFALDATEYDPDMVPHHEPEAVGRAPKSLPTLRIELTGAVTESNLDEFKENAVAVFRGISTDLQTDQDFADAEETVKWCDDIEKRLDAAKDHALSQTESIDRLFRAIDEIRGEARAKRLELNKLVKARKEEIRAEIVQAGIEKVRDHYGDLSSSLEASGMPPAFLKPPPQLAADMGSAIKGKRSISSMRDAVDDTVASHKIAANETAERARANIAVLDEFSEHATLFPDRHDLCLHKGPDDLRNLAKARISEHEQREAERDKARAEQAERDAAAAKARAEQADAQVPAPATAPAPPPAAAQASKSTKTIQLGEINSRIAPLSISSHGLAELGIKQAGKRGNAKLYADADFPWICERLIHVLSKARDDDAGMQQAPAKQAARTEAAEKSAATST